MTTVEEYLGHVGRGCSYGMLGEIVANGAGFDKPIEILQRSHESVS